MGDIRQERPNEGLLNTLLTILNTNKIYHRQPPKKIFDRHVEKSMVFKTF